MVEVVVKSNSREISDIFHSISGLKADPLPDQKRLGLNTSVVLSLTSHLPENFKSCSLFFDLFFTSLLHLGGLTELDYRGKGTIRENIIEKSPLETAAEMKKAKRINDLEDNKRYVLFSGMTIVL